MLVATGFYTEKDYMYIGISLIVLFIILIKERRWSLYYLLNGYDVQTYLQRFLLQQVLPIFVVDKSRF